jgi:EAL domain-containing protein (putative c-di-GMP-specific phosphodiesterase class I)
MKHLEDVAQRLKDSGTDLATYMGFDTGQRAESTLASYAEEITDYLEQNVLEESELCAHDVLDCLASLGLRIVVDDLGIAYRTYARMIQANAQAG